MKEIMDAYNWACPEVPKKIYIKPRVQPSQNFGGRDDQFGGCVEVDVKGSLEINYDQIKDWVKGGQTFTGHSKIKPITTLEVQQSYEIEKLKGDVEFHKDSLINLEKSISTRLNDYNNLEVDYLNSQSENKKLQGRLNELEDVESDNLSLMKRYVNLLDKVVKLDDKKVVSNTWF